MQEHRALGPRGNHVGYEIGVPDAVFVSFDPCLVASSHVGAAKVSPDLHHGSVGVAAFSLVPIDMDTPVRACSPQSIGAKELSQNFTDRLFRGPFLRLPHQVRRFDLGGGQGISRCFGGGPGLQGIQLRGQAVQVDVAICVSFNEPVQGLLGGLGQASADVRGALLQWIKR